MITRHLIDPELIALIDAFPTIQLTLEGLPHILSCKVRQTTQPCRCAQQLDNIPFPHYDVSTPIRDAVRRDTCPASPGSWRKAVPVAVSASGAA